MDIDRQIALNRVKEQLKIDHDYDDDLLNEYLNNAINYAEQHQRKRYSGSEQDVMAGTTKQGILLLVTHWYDNRDGGIDKIAPLHYIDSSVMAVNRLLNFDREVHI